MPALNHKQKAVLDPIGRMAHTQTFRWITGTLLLVFMVMDHYHVVLALPML